MPTKPDSPPVVVLSDEERDSGVLSDIHMFDAVTGYFRDGVVVLQNAIPIPVIDKLSERMLVDTRNIMAGKIPGIHWNHGREKGNVSQVPPMEKEYILPEIYANKPAGAVLCNILGPDPELRYVRSNTLLPNTPVRQRVHKDLKGHHLSHPCAVALNVTLVDASPDNGVTELYLGTHNSATYDDYEDPNLKLGWVKDESLEARKQVRPPVYPFIPKGSLVLRDLRLWHAGMSNRTGETRVMLAFVYTAGWYKNHLLPPWPKSLEPIVQELGKENGTLIAGQFVEEDFDFLGSKFEGDFRSPFRTAADCW